MTQIRKILIRRLSTGLLTAILIGVAFSSINVQNIKPANAIIMCGDTVTGIVSLTADLACSGNGLKVGADNTQIYLNGHTISCTGAGYRGSCQGLGFVGIDTAGFNNVLITGGKNPGTITGFQIGVKVNGGLTDSVNFLKIKGPASPGVGSNPRPEATGIEMENVFCPGDTQVGAISVSNQREGIELNNAHCVTVGDNFVHDNNADPVECSGILLIDSTMDGILFNEVFHNGENLGADGGILLYSSDSNTIVGNLVHDNFGAGISLRSASAANHVVNNEVSGHTLFGGDLSQFGAGVNNYKENCYTTTNIIPPPFMAEVCPRPDVGP